MTQNQYFFEGRNITKKFGALIANDNISFGIKEAEIVGLIGDNAAGKSTLVKQIMGVEQPTEGKFFLDGKEIKIESPIVARQLGINAVYQELAVFPHLNVIENLFAGDLDSFTHFGFLNWKEMAKRTQEVLDSLDIDIPNTKRLIKFLSGGKRQEAVISRVFLYKPRLLLMDEPTAALSVKERIKIMNLVRSLKQKGVSIIYVGHNIEEVFDLVDRVIILSLGAKIADVEKSETTVKELVSIIVSGGKLD
jgi:ABC-type sugar transport system ATPase subunit